jgi:hypothetical protein
MNQIFLSHNHDDHSFVLEVKSSLEKSFLNLWVDEKAIQLGDELSSEIRGAIKESNWFTAFVSLKYVNSKWCKEELRLASRLKDKGKLSIILCLMDSREKIEEHSKNIYLNDLIHNTLTIENDSYSSSGELSEKLAMEVIKKDSFQFNPIKIIEFEGKNGKNVKAQLISYEIKGNLPDDFLRSFEVDLKDHISTSKDDDKVISGNLPVVFSGISINWLTTYLTIPFLNHCSVLHYNNRSKKIICSHVVHSDRDKLQPGDVFDYEI